MRCKAFSSSSSSTQTGFQKLHFPCMRQISHTRERIRQLTNYILSYPITISSCNKRLQNVCVYFPTMHVQYMDVIRISFLVRPVLWFDFVSEKPCIVSHFPLPQSPCPVAFEKKSKPCASNLLITTCFCLSSPESLTPIRHVPKSAYCTHPSSGRGGASHGVIFFFFLGTSNSLVPSEIYGIR